MSDISNTVQPVPEPIISISNNSLAISKHYIQWTMCLQMINTYSIIETIMDAIDRKHISLLGVLHEELVTLRRTFLQNAEARVYLKSSEPPPMPLGMYHPGETSDEFYVSYAYSLSKENEEIDDIRYKLQGPEDRYVRMVRRKHPEPPARLTPEAFSMELLKYWDYDGRSWKVSEHVFESFFPEDRGKAIVEIHWFIPDDKKANIIQREADNVYPLLKPLIENPMEIKGVNSCKIIQEEVVSAIQVDSLRWRPGVVRWTYLKTLDNTITTLSGLALAAGDQPFLSSIGSDEHDKLVIDTRNYSLNWLAPIQV